MHKGDTQLRVVHDHDASLSEGNIRSKGTERERVKKGTAIGTHDALLIDLDDLEDGDCETTETTSRQITTSSSSTTTYIIGDLFSEIIHWIAPLIPNNTLNKMTMSRPRTNSGRLPLYDSRNSRHQNSQASPYGHRTDCDDEEGSPTRKIRRRRSLFLHQMNLKYPHAQYAYYTSLALVRRTPRGVRFLFFLVLGVLLFVWTFWEPHIEITLYPRSWISREIFSVEPLAGCFDPARVSGKYNFTQHLYAPKRTEVHSGMPMRFGMDCYDFAGTIQPLPPSSSHPHPYEATDQRINYHTYWRADLVPFGERQEWMVKSFFATQDLSRARLILWSNGDLRAENPLIRRWLRKFPESFQVRIVDVDELARGTALEGSELLYKKDEKAWVDGDLVRLLVTWAYGGVWVDMDSLLTRDLYPLLEHEFVTQWDCYDKIYQPMNGAVMHFFQHSPYLCEAFHIISRSPPPQSGSTEWGSLLYFKLWRRLVAGGVPPFKVLPFCFTDGRSCRLDNRLPDPFVKDKESRFWYNRLSSSSLSSSPVSPGGGVGAAPPPSPPHSAAGAGGTGTGMAESGSLDVTLHTKVFSVHLHNQWHKHFPRGGWVERLLLRRYDRALGIEESPLHHRHGHEYRYGYGGLGEEGFVVSKDDD